MSLRISRRRTLQLGLTAGGAILFPTITQKIGRAQVFSDDSEYRSPRRPAFFARDFQVPPVLQPVRVDNTTQGSNGSLGFSGTDYYEVTMRKGSVEILPGVQTEVWGYNGITPGPTIRQQKNRQSVIRYINDLGSDSTGTPIHTSVHAHGMASLPQYDGWADDITYPGQYKDYIYPNNRPATIWYHDHGVHRTALNAYMGLVAGYIVDDPDEKADIPKGEFDVPLLLGDKLLNRAGQLVYADHGHKDLFGDIVLVNGVPWPRMAVKRRRYRFRVLSCGITRAYNLRLSNGAAFHVIATDGGLLETPISTTSLVAGVAERYEIVIDFSQYPAGTQIELRNGDLDNHESFPGTNRIMRFDVVGGTVDNPPLPTKLRNDDFNYTTHLADLKAQAKRTREIVFERSGSEWRINGRTWADGGLEANPGLGDVEIWKLVNKGGGWNHPIHIHLTDFLMMKRVNGPLRNYERGFKDTVYLGENHEIHVITKFGPHAGKYMFHCHNLVHEDHDMMRAFEVGQGGPDPVTTAPARPYDANVLPL